MHHTYGNSENISIADVLVAMSGGVDSTVAAMLLVQQGYKVAGITMKLFDNRLIGETLESQCCSLEDIQDAQSACRKLGIEHFTFNLKTAFEDNVVRKFCEAYLRGLTPNPCIDCNRYLKFAKLQQRRRELGASFVATGHYARRRFDEDTGKWELLRAADKAKDQSYVLYHLTQDDLAHMLFPLGDLRKAEVRAMAKKAGFDNAEKRESQDICFVPDGDYAAFIRRYTDDRGIASPGYIVDKDGRKIGEHGGLMHYTIGQRKGIGIASKEPLYVMSKDIDSNLLVVSTLEDLLVNEVGLNDINIVSAETEIAACNVKLKTGYRQQPTSGMIEVFADGTGRAIFDEPIIRPAPGQSLVAYSNEAVLCGGTIVDDFSKVQ